MRSDKSLKQLSILLAEDEINVAEHMAALLRRYVHSVLIARDGVEGVELYKSHRPDIVLTDIEMPNMNGLEMCQAIKAVDADVPIVIISAFENRDFLRNAIEIGVDSYLSKPIRISSLLEKLEKLSQRLEHRKKAEEFNSELRRMVEEKTEALNRANHELQKFNNELERIVQEKTQELYKQKDFLDSLIDTADILIVLLDEEANILFLNRYGLELLGRKEHEVLGRNWIEDFIPSDNQNTVKDIFHKIYRGEKRYGGYENFVIDRNGAKRALQWRNSLLKDREGATTGLLSVGTDVTEKKIAQDRRARLSRALHTTYQASQELIKHYSSLEDALHCVCTTLMQNENFPCVRINLEERDGVKTIAECDCEPPASENSKFSLLSIPMLPEEGAASLGTLSIITKDLENSLKEERKVLEEFASMVAIAIRSHMQKREILELNNSLEKRVKEKTRQLEEKLEEVSQKNRELEEAKREALQASEAKSMFISHVSHELRTPLNAIINFTDQIVEDFDLMKNDDDLWEENRGFLTRVLRNSHHLLDLINEILDFTKIREGKVKYQMQPCNVNEVLEMLYANHYSLFKNSGARFLLELSTEPLHILTDRRRFFQILSNLLSNSIKFTDTGHITLRSKKEGAYVIVEVEDTGRGIPHDSLETVFEPFGQVKQYDQGTGLGLAIVKEMCLHMEMEINVHSVFGEGSTFSIQAKYIDTTSEEISHTTPKERER